jgi:putative hydrolase of the HAD superfamily
VLPLVRVIFFDLDGTLYHSAVIREKFAEAAACTLKKFTGVSLDDAHHLIQTMRQQLRLRYKDSVPDTLVLQAFGVSIDFWHKENIAYFDPRDYLEKDDRLRQCLVEMKTRYRLAILTNNNATQTQRTLEALGVGDVFDEVFTYNTYRLLKPDSLFLHKALERCGVRPDECLFVGDRYGIDLEPAQSIGMHIYEVRGPEEIYTMYRTMKKEEGA